MSVFYDTVKNYFAGADWSYEELGNDVLATDFSGDDAAWTCLAQVSEENRQLIFYSIFPQYISDQGRADVMEFITRINYGLSIGNFELDLQDGEVRFKTSIDVEGSELSFGLWRHIVYLNVTTMNTYFRGIEAVAAGSVGPQEMIEAIEQENFADKDSKE